MRCRLIVKAINETVWKLYVTFAWQHLSQSSVILFYFNRLTSGWLRGYLLRPGGLLWLSRSPRATHSLNYLKLYAGKTLFSYNLSSTTLDDDAGGEKTCLRQTHQSHVFLPFCHFIIIQTIPNFPTDRILSSLHPKPKSKRPRWAFKVL